LWEGAHYSAGSFFRMHGHARARCARHAPPGKLWAGRGVSG
jgi:hypothetical protein